MDATAIDRRAIELTAQANALIAERCEGESHLRYETIAEQVACELLPADEWEYLLNTPVFGPPRIAITRYMAVPRPSPNPRTPAAERLPSPRKT